MIVSQAGQKTEWRARGGKAAIASWNAARDSFAHRCLQHAKTHFQQLTQLCQSSPPSSSAWRLLFLGRKLFWLFVAAVGFVVGMEAATTLYPHQPDWSLIVGLILGLIGAVAAIFVQKAAIGIAGFLVSMVRTPHDGPAPVGSASARLLVDLVPHRRPHRRAARHPLPSSSGPSLSSHPSAVRTSSSTPSPLATPRPPPRLSSSRSSASWPRARCSAPRAPKIPDSGRRRQMPGVLAFVALQQPLHDPVREQRNRRANHAGAQKSGPEHLQRFPA